MKGKMMRFGMMAAVGILAAMAGMAHGERDYGKTWSVPNYSVPNYSHIYLQPPAPVPIEPTQHLQVADASGFASKTATQSSNTAAGILTPELVREIENEINKETSVCASPHGTGQDWLNEDGIVAQSFVPAGWIVGTLERDYRIKLPAGTVIPTRLTQGPQHGELVIIDSHYNSRGDVKGTGPFTERYRYTPDLAYYKAHGIYQDTAKFEVDIGGYTFHLKFTIDVSSNPCGVMELGDVESEELLDSVADPVIRVTLESVTSQAQEGAPANAVLAQIDCLRINGDRPRFPA